MTNQEVTIINDKPPVWDSVCKAFNIIPMNAIFSYGDRIYNPQGNELADHLIEHEKVHLRQQEHSEQGAIMWWGKFLRDEKFRVDNEIEAYARQYQFYCSKVKDRNQQFKFLDAVARSMSGPLYNKSITYQEAMNRIKNHKKVQP